ncbi:unnamed protein product, partial [Symbiodinium sp. KB8]
QKLTFNKQELQSNEAALHDASSLQLLHLNSQRVAAYFNDDGMFHERVLLWKSRAMNWMILTPDLDVYMEDFSGHGDPGCDYFRIKDVDFRYWSRVGGSVYRFSRELDDSELKDMIGIAVQELGDEVFAPGAWRPTGIILKNKVVADPTEFLGRILVQRRLHGKGPAARKDADPTVGDHATGSWAPIDRIRPAVEGWVWLAAEPLGGFTLGEEVTINAATDVQVGERTALVLRGGVWVKAELVKIEDASDFAHRRLALYGATPTAVSPVENLRLVDETPEAGTTGKAQNKDEEVRTLWVDYDEQGDRFKRWRDVCRESYTPVFEEKPLDGPLTALHFIKHAERHGGDVRQWFQLWCRSKHVEPTDRIYHELKVLTDAIHFAGTHDQVNIPALISLEIICRRVQSVVEAYTNPNKPSWEHAKVFQGQGSPEDIVSPIFRSYAVKKNKEELELLQARLKVRELRGAPVTASEDTGAEGSESQPSRRARIRKAFGNCNEVIKALNWMAGKTDREEVLANASRMQLQALSRVEGLVFDQKPSGDLATPEEALRSLLHGGSPYDWVPSNETLASYDPDLLSIPSDVSGCPFLRDVLPESDCRFLEEKSELMLGVENVQEASMKPYWDPKLRFNKKAYNDLVRRLDAIQYFRYTTKPACKVGVFFVWKSSRTRLRLITDARLANKMFKAAPGVSLMSSESFGRIEVTFEDSIFADPEQVAQFVTYLGLSDVKDCFHRLRVPMWLARYFAWEAVPAKVVGLQNSYVDGEYVGPLDPVWPCAGSLCQGFSWSLYFAQRANERVSQSCSLLAEARLLHDRGPSGYLCDLETGPLLRTHLDVGYRRGTKLHYTRMPCKRTRTLSCPVDDKPRISPGKSSRKRALSLDRDHIVPGTPSGKMRDRRLGASHSLGLRMTESKVEALSLPSRDVELKKVPQIRKARVEEDPSESASTSSELAAERSGGNERILKARPKRLLKQTVDAGMNNSASPLETAAVSAKVRDNYQKRLRDLHTFIDTNKLRFRTDEEVDTVLVEFFNMRYRAGEGSSVGDYTLAALLDKHPEFGRLGSRKIPRAWRCLQGWRKLCPSRSRLAYPLAVWCAISWRMVVRGHVAKALFNLLQVSTYLRPGTLLKLRRMGLVRPTSGVTGHWSVVTSLTETADVSKTGTKDDSVLLDSEWLQFASPLLEELTRGSKLDKVWRFD